jgi:hypothetical protein
MTTFRISKIPWWCWLLAAAIAITSFVLGLWWLWRHHPIMFGWIWSIFSAETASTAWEKGGLSLWAAIIQAIKAACINNVGWYVGGGVISLCFPGQFVRGQQWVIRMLDSGKASHRRWTTRHSARASSWLFARFAPSLPALDDSCACGSWWSKNLRVGRCAATPGGYWTATGLSWGLADRSSWYRFIIHIVTSHLVSQGANAAKILVCGYVNHYLHWPIFSMSFIWAVHIVCDRIGSFRAKQTLHPSKEKNQNQEVTPSAA